LLRNKKLRHFSLELIPSGHTLNPCAARCERRAVYKELPMFFAATQPTLRRNVYSPAGSAMERFLDQARNASRNSTPQYAQDELSYTIGLDVPGISKEQLSISIEGAVVRILSRESASRQYRAAYELPTDIDPALSEARLENGVLTLKLAKKVPVSTATELPVL